MRGSVRLLAATAREALRDWHSYHGSCYQVASVARVLHESPTYPAAVAIDRAASD